MRVRMRNRGLSASVLASANPVLLAEPLRSPLEIVKYPSPLLRRENQEISFNQDDTRARSGSNSSSSSSEAGSGRAGGGFGGFGKAKKKKKKSTVSAKKKIPDIDSNSKKHAVDVHHLAREMLDLMYKTDGVGLAAPQVSTLFTEKNNPCQKG